MYVLQYTMVSLVHINNLLYDKLKHKIPNFTMYFVLSGDPRSYLEYVGESNLIRGTL